MRNKILFSLSALFLSLQFVMAQTKTIVDPRDNQEYTIIKIESNWWFQDNLQYESRYSHCPNFNRKASDCIDINFYPFTELDTICPAGWHVATLKNWEDYFNFMLSQNEVPETALETETYIPILDIQIADTTQQIKLFAHDNLLKLKPLGWIQGRKLHDMGTITMWAKNEELKDDKYHLHIGDTGYVKHTHEHHILDKPRKNRKFIVRCVCEDENLKE